PLDRSTDVVHVVAEGREVSLAGVGDKACGRQLGERSPHHGDRRVRVLFAVEQRQRNADFAQVETEIANVEAKVPGGAASPLPQALVNRSPERLQSTWLGEYGVVGRGKSLPELSQLLLSLTLGDASHHAEQEPKHELGSTGKEHGQPVRERQ